MDWKRWSGERKRRPREHVIAEMNVNFLERQVLRRGHELRRVPEPEYGTDALMLHFSPETREIENGWVEFQVKATDAPDFVDGGNENRPTLTVRIPIRNRLTANAIDRFREMSLART